MFKRKAERLRTSARMPSAFCGAPKWDMLGKNMRWAGNAVSSKYFVVLRNLEVACKRLAFPWETVLWEWTQILRSDAVIVIKGNILWAIANCNSMPCKMSIYWVKVCVHSPKNLSLRGFVYKHSIIKQRTSASLLICNHHFVSKYCFLRGFLKVLHTTRKF